MYGFGGVGSGRRNLISSLRRKYLHAQMILGSNPLLLLWGTVITWAVLFKRTVLVFGREQSSLSMDWTRFKGRQIKVSFAHLESSALVSAQQSEIKLDGWADVGWVGRAGLRNSYHRSM